MSSLEVGGCDAFERSFDFSKFPNLQKVYLGVGWVGGNLLWILTALSTLRPATSPRLSTIQLKFTRPPTRTRYVETAIECTVDDLRRIADEVTRIKREFKGALSVTVLRDPKFEAVLDAFNVRFHLRGEYLIVPLIHSHPFLADLSTLRSLETDPQMLPLVTFNCYLRYRIIRSWVPRHEETQCFMYMRRRASRCNRNFNTFVTVLLLSHSAQECIQSLLLINETVRSSLWRDPEFGWGGLNSVFEHANSPSRIEVKSVY